MCIETLRIIKDLSIGQGRLIATVVLKGYYTNIEEYCLEQYIILHELVSAIWYTARDNIPQY